MCDLEACIHLVFFPASVLETYSFGRTTSGGREYISNSCYRNSLRRIVALVAPIFHLYECAVNISRLIFCCCTDKSFHIYLFNYADGVISNAFDSLRDALSSLCEIPSKLIFANRINYFGSERRHKYGLRGEFRFLP